MLMSNSVCGSSLFAFTPTPTVWGALRLGQVTMHSWKVTMQGIVTEINQ